MGMKALVSGAYDVSDLVVVNSVAGKWRSLRIGVVDEHNGRPK